MPQIKFKKYIQEKDVKIKDEESDHFYSIKKIYYSEQFEKTYDTFNSIIVEIGESIGGEITDNIYEASINDEKYIIKKIHLYDNLYGKYTLEMFKKEIKYQNLCVPCGLSDPILFAYVKNEKECGFLMKKYPYSLYDILDDYHLDLEDKIPYLDKVKKILEKLDEAKICHGNFQSTNIMIDENDELKLIDFEKAFSLKKDKTKKNVDSEFFAEVGCKLVKTSEEIEMKLEDYWYDIMEK